MLLARRATSHMELKIFCLIQIHLSIGAILAIQLCNESNVKSKSTYYTGTTTNSNSMYIDSNDSDGSHLFVTLTTRTPIQVITQVCIFQYITSLSNAIVLVHLLQKSRIRATDMLQTASVSDVSSSPSSPGCSALIHTFNTPTPLPPSSMPSVFLGIKGGMRTVSSSH